MPLPIEDYAVLGDTGTAALVGKDGSIDWLCLPRFDSPACFAALLGGPEHGRWLIGPTDEKAVCEREYVGNSAVLRTTYTTDTGTVRVVDVMPVNDGRADLVRRVTGQFAPFAELVMGGNAVLAGLTDAFGRFRPVPSGRVGEGEAEFRLDCFGRTVAFDVDAAIGGEDGAVQARGVQRHGARPVERRDAGPGGRTNRQPARGDVERVHCDTR